MSIQIERIDQISVRVHDIERAISFYRNKLGLKMQFNTGNMAFFDVNGITIMLSIPETGEFDHPGSVIYFAVKDINTSYKTLLDNSVNMRGEPHIVYQTESFEQWMAFFEDEDNNLLALTSHVIK